jgi:hypothetical protein
MKGSNMTKVHNFNIKTLKNKKTPNAQFSILLGMTKVHNFNIKTKKCKFHPRW